MKKKLRFAKPCRLCGSINGYAKFILEKRKTGIDESLCVHYEAVNGVIWPASHLTRPPE